MVIARLGVGAALGGALCVAAGAAVVFDQGRRVRRALAAARDAAARPPFERRVPIAHARVLVLGDSTGSGMGAAAPDEAIPGLLARDHPTLEIVNLSVSGARMADVPQQIHTLPPGSAPFDLLLLHVGGNDILRARRLAELDEPAEAMVRTLRPLARRTLWLGPGDLGLAPLFRPPFNWWFSRRTFAAAERFDALSRRHGIRFIGFHDAPHREVIAADPARYFADDGIHPSTACYRYCYRWLIDSAALGFSPAGAAAAERVVVSRA